MNDQKFRLERVRGVLVAPEEILSDLRLVAKKAGTDVISQKLYKNFGAFDPSTAIRKFGSWNEAVLAAGLKVANEVDISDDRLFENLMLLWTHYGRQPRRVELASSPSKFSQSAYNRRFGSWTDALAAFVDFANAAEVSVPDRKENASRRKTPGEPSERLKWRVRQRDNFVCRACGASPSLQPGLPLHVDHIVPWSRGGDTTEENLQTLCQPCNLSKGNL
ncbi:MAG: HNH endonuclease [Roseomonas sp.]|nr:HNH endonuclease [Roseomonas sp.]